MNDTVDRARLELPAVLDLAAADGFLATLLQRLEAARPLRLDAGAVETITYPCIQIILAAMRGGNRISIEQPSAAFVSAFRDLGLDWAVGQQPIPCEPDSGQVDYRDEVVSLAPNQIHEEPMTKRIMTIDDSKTMRDMLKLTLVNAGFDVLQGVDGQDGIDVLGENRVDVVITDINMPRMDGYEVIRQLRSNPVHKSTPILVLTTESDTEKKQLARDAGATGWMVKPFDPDRLIATVRKVAP